MSGTSINSDFLAPKRLGQHAVGFSHGPQLAQPDPAGMAALHVVAEQYEVFSEDVKKRLKEELRTLHKAARSGEAPPEDDGGLEVAVVKLQLVRDHMVKMLRHEIASLPPESRGQFDDQIEAIDKLKEEWLKKYEQALAKYIEFFREFSEIMAKLKDGVTADSDPNFINLNLKSLSDALYALEAKYKLASNGLASFASQKQADDFIKELNLSGLTVKRDGNKYVVMIDTKPVFDLNKSFPNTAKWDMAKYNAWLSAKDSYVETLQHPTKVLAEKYSRKVQDFDALFKLLSAQIESTSEADKTVARNL